MRNTCGITTYRNHDISRIKQTVSEHSALRTLLPIVICFLSKNERVSATDGLVGGSNVASAAGPRRPTAFLMVMLTFDDVVRLADEQQWQAPARPRDNNPLEEYCDSPSKRAKLQWASTESAVMMHTPAAMRMRAALRSHPRVLEALEAWWLTAQNTMQRKATKRGRTCTQVLPKKDYLELNVLLYKAMVPEWDEEDANSTAKESWVEDAGAGAKSLTADRFRDSMFELADMHTLHIKSSEIVTFLDTLLERVSEVEFPSVDAPARRYFASLDTIMCSGVYSPYKATSTSSSPHGPSSPLRQQHRNENRGDHFEAATIDLKAKAKELQQTPMPAPSELPAPSVPPAAGSQKRPRPQGLRTSTSAFGLLTGGAPGLYLTQEALPESIQPFALSPRIPSFSSLGPDAVSAKIEALRAQSMAQPRLDLLAHARRMGAAGRSSPSPAIRQAIRPLTATDGRTRLGASHTLPPVRPRSSGGGAPPTILQPWKLGPTRR